MPIFGGGNEPLDAKSVHRGFCFGTVLVDLERHRVIDLLPDRRVETAAQWMRERPDITAVSRDRGGEYASAASQAVPWAVQVADKFHLAKNLTEAMQLLLARCQAEIFVTSHTGETGQSEPNELRRELRPLEPVHVKNARLARREGRLARYQEVEKLHQQGFKPKEIAQRLGLSDRTVQKWVAASTFPEAKQRRRKASSFDAFTLFLHKREGHRLERWLAQVAKSDLPELQKFARGVERDKAAVQAGLTWEINNGQVEGHVTKIKLIKRQMYGKAGFALLRQRVLHAL